MIAHLRRAVPARRDEQGTTLTELLVSMLVFSILLAAVGTLTIGFTRTNAQSISRQNQVDSARVVVSTMTKTLRTAVMPNQLTSTCTLCTEDAFVIGKGFSVQFYANINNPGNTVGPSRVTYTLTTTGADAGTLVEKVQVPDSNIPSATGYAYCDAEASGSPTACRNRLSTRVLARGVQSDTGPIFAYYDRTGAQLTPPTNGTLTAAELKKVLAVELVVSVQAQDATKVDPTTYIQRVTLPNAQAVLRQEEED
ncbi:prepilin-type N-terminal cleavage/methylation domain-containing protein [uncultured Cellulomonas sp.]|uniref:PulJ/GspJ family protein n=1 Tax=uncultured Cellulomonas sp. TaxID=189682 RepID=UPI0028ED6EE6|nr:prepilin-type N-terminal cleavage/methylation domain-containing protein [uncultured Cellulomonas sp.]